MKGRPCGGNFRRLWMEDTHSSCCLTHTTGLSLCLMPWQMRCSEEMPLSVVPAHNLIKEELGSDSHTPSISSGNRDVATASVGYEPWPSTVWLSSPLEESSVLPRTSKRPFSEERFGRHGGFSNSSCLWMAQVHVSNSHSQPVYISYCPILSHKLLAQANRHPHQCHNKGGVCSCCAIKPLLAELGIHPSSGSCPSLPGLLSQSWRQDTLRETHM